MLPRAFARKNNGFMRGLIVFVFIFLLMAGCATTPKSLMPEETARIKKLAIVMVPKNEELVVIDHTNVWKKSYGGYMFGAIGGLVEGLILTVEDYATKKASLGGDPNLLKDQLKEYQIRKILEEKITGKLSEKYEIQNPNYLCDDLKKTKKDQKLVIEDYLDVCKRLEADTLLEIDFYYGLAAYAGEKSSAIIIANISVHDVNANNLLMKREFISDEHFKKNRVVPDFAANSAELYKKDILDIVNGFTQLVALEFGLKTDEVFMFKKDFDEIISALRVSCKKPYKLDQDCSIWTGAKRTIKINEKEIKVAGSADGKIILVMDNKIIPNNESVSCCFQLVKEKLAVNGVEIIKVTKLVFDKRDYGYILNLNNDGYSFLKNLTVEKEEEASQPMTNQ